MEHRTMERNDVYAKIDEEREYQQNKWGDKPQSLPGYLLILKKEIDEAIDGWMKNSEGRDAPLNEILQVAAVAVACMEQYGCDGITYNTLDVVPPDQPTPNEKTCVDRSIESLDSQAAKWADAFKNSQYYITKDQS